MCNYLNLNDESYQKIADKADTKVDTKSWSQLTNVEKVKSIYPEAVRDEKVQIQKSLAKTNQFCGGGK